MLHQRHQHLSTKVWSRVWSSLARRLSTLSKVWRHPKKGQGYTETYQRVRALLRWWSHQWVRETPAGAGPMLLPGPPCYTQTQPLNGQLVSFCCRISHSRLPGITTTTDHASAFSITLHENPSATQTILLPWLLTNPNLGSLLPLVSSVV